MSTDTKPTYKRWMHDHVIMDQNKSREPSRIQVIRGSFVACPELYTPKQTESGKERCWKFITQLPANKNVFLRVKVLEKWEACAYKYLSQFFCMINWVMDGWRYLSRGDNFLQPKMPMSSPVLSCIMISVNVPRIFIFALLILFRKTAFFSAGNISFIAYIIALSQLY